jgi:hypothetical protein
VLVALRVSTLASLPCAERVRVLERVERSRLAFLTLMLAALKTMFCFLFFEDPAELEALGYREERHRHERAPSLVRAEGATH